jgi:hypothetical protein
MFEVLLIKPSTNKGQINRGRVILKLSGSQVDKKFAASYGSSMLAGLISLLILYLICSVCYIAV